MGSGFAQSLPWAVVAEFAGASMFIIICLTAKGVLYKRYRQAGRFAVMGLVAVQYLGIATVEPPKGAVEILAVIAMLAVIFWLYRKFHVLKIHIGDNLQSTFDVKREQAPKPRPGMVLFLSFLTGRNAENRLDFAGKPTRVLSAGTNEYEDHPDWTRYREHILELARSLGQNGAGSIEDAGLLKPFGAFNIRMPLEAIRSQLAAGALKHIVLISSKDSKRREKDSILREQPYTGSGGQTEFFREVYREVFSPLCARLPEIEVTDPADFENEEEISQAIEHARRLLKAGGANHHYVDITGGQAICSIVGAVRSLGREERCQYISTRDYKPIVYDFVVEAPPEIG